MVLGSMENGIKGLLAMSAKGNYNEEESNEVSSKIISQSESHQWLSQFTIIPVLLSIILDVFGRLLPRSDDHGTRLTLRDDDDEQTGVLRKFGRWLIQNWVTLVRVSLQGLMLNRLILGPTVLFTAGEKG